LARPGAPACYAGLHPLASAPGWPPLALPYPTQLLPQMQHESLAHLGMPTPLAAGVPTVPATPLMSAPLSTPKPNLSLHAGTLGAGGVALGPLGGGIEAAAGNSNDGIEQPRFSNSPDEQPADAVPLASADESSGEEVMQLDGILEFLENWEQFERPSKEGGSLIDFGGYSSSSGNEGGGGRRGELAELEAALNRVESAPSLSSLERGALALEGDSLMADGGGCGASGGGLSDGSSGGGGVFPDG